LGRPFDPHERNSPLDPRGQGVNQGENLTLACRNAVLTMMALLQERGSTGEQAHVICSVAVDLRIRNEGFDLQMIAAELARGAPR